MAIGFRTMPCCEAGGKDRHHFGCGVRALGLGESNRWHRNVDQVVTKTLSLDARSDRELIGAATRVGG